VSVFLVDLPKMKYSLGMSTYICSSSKPLECVLIRLCPYYHYQNMYSVITFFNSFFIIINPHLWNPLPSVKCFFFEISGIENDMIL